MNMKNLLKTPFVRNTAWVIASRVYQIVLNLAVSVLTSRYLGPGNYGLVQYAASFASLLTAFCTLGMGDVMVPSLVESPEKQGRLLGTAIGMRLISSLLSVMTVCLAVWVLNPGESLTLWVTALYCGGMVLQSLETIRYFYQKHLLSRITSLLTILVRTAVAAYKIALLIFQKDVLWFAFANVVDHGLFGLLLLLAYARHRGAGQRLRFDRRIAARLLKSGSPFILSGLLVALYGQADKIIIKHLLGESQVGLYAAALVISGQWTFLLSAAIDSARPLIMEQFTADRDQFRQNLTRLYRMIFLLCLAAAAALTALAEPLVRLLYGADYLGAVGALRILPWGTAFSYLGVARSIWAVPNGRQGYEKYLALIGALSNVALNLLLIPLWGICGAAAATVLTQIITNFLCGFLFRPLGENTALILAALGVKKE